MILFRDRELPTESYIDLCSKVGHVFPEIVTNSEPDTVKIGHWYTFQGKLSQAIGVSHSLILIQNQS